MSHAPTAFCRLLHETPHAPHDVEEVLRLASQPSEIILLQSARPLLQLAITH
jgi:hypothetical protein